MIPNVLPMLPMFPHKHRIYTRGYFLSRPRSDPKKNLSPMAHDFRAGYIGIPGTQTQNRKDYAHLRDRNCSQ